MQYRVELVQTVVEVCTVFVEAINAQQAEDLALQQVTTGSGADWRFKDTLDGIEVLSTQQMENDYVVSKLEYLTRRWYEVDQLRYQKLAEIRQITGDDSWMRRRCSFVADARAGRMARSAGTTGRRKVCKVRPEALRSCDLSALDRVRHVVSDVQSGNI